MKRVCSLNVGRYFKKSVTSITPQTKCDIHLLQQAAESMLSLILIYAVRIKTINYEKDPAF